MTFKIIETFSGIGAQAKAFENIKKRNPTFNYEVTATVEWEIGAMFAYDIIHNGPQNLSQYENLSKENLIKSLEDFNLSSDGKNPMKKSTLKRMSEIQLRSIYHSIIKNNNLVDISAVKAEDLPDADLLTYSFPCQDLSISSYWHSNFSGIDKNIKNRSGLLWQIERILNEYEQLDKAMPRFLLMENVSAIEGPLHEQNFKLWQNELIRLGYRSHIFQLNAANFGIPQNRMRTFMISTYFKDLSQKKINKVLDYFSSTKLNKVTKNPSIDDYLRLDYSNSIYYKEALASTPNDTPSRQKIGMKSVPLANGSVPTKEIAKTITTKQDRFPNAGIINLDERFAEGKSKYRNLTPRETFLLMGFEESDFQKLLDNNFNVSKSRKMLSQSKLLKLSGNSIVVNVLEEIFSELIIINNTIIKDDSNVIYFEKTGN